MKKLSLLEIFEPELVKTGVDTSTNDNETNDQSLENQEQSADAAHMSIQQIANSIEDNLETEIDGEDSEEETKTVSEELVLESANTLAADVNEILMGTYLLGGTWKGFQNAGEASAQVKLRKTQISPEEYANQNGRAKAMANSVMAWAASNGYKGKVVSVWWTARPGILSTAFGRPVDSKSNPTDILLKFSDGQFLGVSAKSTKKSSGEISFKNPGAGTVAKALKIDLDKLFKTRTAVAIKKLKLPVTMKERKQYIKSKPNVKTKTDIIGAEILSSMRDILYNALVTKSPKDLREYILKYWMDADAIEPRYIKATGYGMNGAYSASVLDPLNNDYLIALASPKLTVTKVGNDSVGIIAGNKKKIMKMRFKYESTKIASSLKLSGDPW